MKIVRRLVQLYVYADIYVNPISAYMFPTVNLEALACGTPVITYRTGGSPEAVDEQTGVVVEQGNVEQLSKAISLSCKTPLRAKYCRNRALAYFDKDKCFEEYIKLYETLS